MRIFVSHAIKDSKLINDLKSNLEPHGLELLIAEHHPDIKYSTITEKIENMIKSSNVALFLLTKNGFNSNFVQQEIGYIRSSKIPHLQVVEKGIEKKITGFIYGKGYIEYSPDDPNKTIFQIKDTLLKYWDDENERKRKIDYKNKKIRQIKRMEQERKDKQLSVGIGIIAGALIIGLLNSNE